jgi:hypothetical protein
VYDSEPFESSSEPVIGYESPQVEDVEICAGTVEAASMALPISQTG